MEKDFDPYPPMEASLSGQPARCDEEDEPVRGPFSFGAVVRETIRLFRRHFVWGALLLLLPELGNAAVVLLESVGQEQQYQGVTTAIALLYTGPLAIGAMGALYWRLAGSAADGPLVRGPFASLFYGFRFFGLLFLWGLVIAGVMIALAIVPIVLFFALLFGADGAAGFDAAPVAWAAFIGASTIAGIAALAILSRWGVALPLAVAEGRSIGPAIRASAALVRGRLLAVCALLVLLAVLTTGATTGLDMLVRAISVAGEGELFWVAYPGAVVHLALALFGGVLNVAGTVALYRVLRGTAAPEPG